ncbi:nicotinamide N-methyltransferase-like protein [Thermochaetoides thermophila DSM 1495]|uniref:Protein N-terminal and lysine N-methyltransferase EFM7 n=1 Tax=Chaetomium thermophilum (strain DSM 1495 / CBS 144.50 / IMI 039719) TaxID=759272 RepID=G0SAL1_CHATD|nr:nicotinamide N-methyltransferase-like protein [Thermochaetoides thermophila DSM 1495]EGS19783.1 nicotinamide N-methyltransferase-like protein [Thermochaetoides thermophila DSM 1495]
MSDIEADPPLNDLFVEPEGYYPPTPPPTTTFYTTLTGDTITLHLVGHSPLEAHHLWNASRVVAEHFERNPDEVRGRTVLELGAGAGLPSLVASALGAKMVVMTDYPDVDLVRNMWRNVDECALIPREAKKGSQGAEEGDEPTNIVVDGYIWGADTTKLLKYLESDTSSQEPQGFDLLILADLLFRHTEHRNMLKTVRHALKRTRDAKALVVFCSYRPWLQKKDLAFFDLAREQGFEVEKVMEKKMDRPLFENDPGDVEILKTVTGWELRWPETECLGNGEVKANAAGS